jgi:hypothetical protein
MRVIEEDIKILTCQLKTLRLCFRVKTLDTKVTCFCAAVTLSELPLYMHTQIWNAIVVLE